MGRIAIVKKERCNPVACGNFLCMRVCPINRQKKECIYEGDDKKASIDEGLCIGCMICVHKCPFDAIDIVNLPDELTTKPVHRYGRNGFHLYNIPVPQFGQTIGILGRNGIGKSTTLKVLANQLKPNLGTDEPATLDALKDYFKGSVAFQFFEKSDAAISYKPQHVDAIPKMVSGTVKDVLSKLDQRSAYDEVVDALDLRHLEGSSVDKLSGGELQRVAIAAASLKNASVFFFDEPSSYLDIKQRLNMARYIKNLSSEERAVMVIEHDLIVMDFLTDLVHIVFGKPGSYGIVSQPYNSRVGMNAFLDGFLKSENMRFRNYPIQFATRPPIDRKRQVQLISWKDISVDLGGFQFESQEGSLQNCEVVGVLGENGIGKTTFIKILAGVLESKGEMTESIKVAYKPQYVEAKEELVRVLLERALTHFHNELITPLELEPLLNRNFNELSGGEMQRVAIAACLAQDADLYLLDEPSAYLDVEQRLAISKIIRDRAEMKTKCILVVDHDLVFIDYISDRLMVFNGQPGRKGSVKGIYSMEEGMNEFLTGLDITFRRDEQTKRPRANKLHSQLDKQQKAQNKRYYSQ